MTSYRKQLSILLQLSFLWTVNSYSVEVSTHELPPTKPGAPQPWFTGPIFAPTSRTVPVGHVAVEPYLFSVVTCGHYNNHWHTESIPNFYSNALELLIQTGITPWMDFRATPQAFYNIHEGAKSFEFGDLQMGIGFQLLKEVQNTWIPNIKLAFRGNIPFGKYQHLNPHKNGTDGVGDGSWDPAILLIFGKIIHTSGIHFLSPRLEIKYTVPTPVHVKDLNVYGGGKGTRGWAYPGNLLYIDFAWEYSLSQSWALALDTIYIHENKTRFSGKTPLLAPVGHPSLEQFSLAPAIEYNFNVNIGLIAGAWFTIFGRNTAQFASGVIALSIYH